MGNHFCGVPDHSIEQKPERTMSVFRNFEPQTTIVIGKGIPNVCSQVPNNPQQNRFEFNDTYFDSKFESGNLAQVERLSPDAFNLWISPDCYKTPHQVRYQSWFYFKVEIRPNSDLYHTRIIHLRIKNINLSEYNQISGGMTLIYRTKSTNEKWEYLPTGIEKVEKNENFVAITFQCRFSNKDSVVSFACSFPYTHTDLGTFLTRMEKQASTNKRVAFIRDIIANSIEGRPIELITITGKDASNGERTENIVHQSSTGEISNGESQELQSPTHVKFYPNRKYIVITCRSQASGTSSNFVLEGLIKSLLIDSAESRKALENFVFLIIPMVNPDGVVRGHSITDTRGKKLNMAYHKHLLKEHYPAPYAIKKLVTDLKFKLHMYWDLESTSAQDGAILEAYMQGNYKFDADAVAIARLFESHSSQFSVNNSKLVHSDGVLKSLPSMKEDLLLDKIPSLNLESSNSLKKNSLNDDDSPLRLVKDFKNIQKTHKKVSRNFVANLGGTHLSFTLKMNLVHGKKRRAGQSNDADSLLDLEESKQENRPQNLLTQEQMRGVGMALVDVVLEYNSCHPKSLLPNSQYASLEKLKKYSQFLLRSNYQRDLRNTVG